MDHFAYPNPGPLTGQTNSFGAYFEIAISIRQFVSSVS